MRMRAFVALAGEAARDALQRRFVAVVALILLFGLASANTCTGIDAHVNLQGRELDPALVAGLAAPLLFSLQAFAVLLIAGVLASDHLAQPLAEGGAVLWLARPVSRADYAGARLAGVLAVALGAGIVLLGGTGAMLLVRQHLAAAPAGLAAAATVLGAATVAALAMAASLALGRMAVLLLVVFGIPLQVLANALGLAAALAHPGMSFGGLFGALDRLGPPLGTAVFAAVSAWNPHVAADGVLLPALARLALWAGGAVVLLVVAFRRVEIR